MSKRSPLPAVLPLLLAACSPGWYAADADAEVGAVLAEADSRALAGREAWIEQPAARVESAEPPEGEDATAESGADAGAAADATAASQGPPLLELTLQSALKAGFSSAREYQSRSEALYLAGLGLTLTRFGFGPQLDATVSYLWGNSETAPGTHAIATDLSVSQRLATGGTFAVGTGLSTSRVGGPHGADPDNGRDWSSDLDFSLSQPLLRGSGYAAAWEALTQAERSILYSVREFELFRQDHAISIVAEYFGLISQRTQLANTRQAYEVAVYDRKSSEAKRQVDRVTEADLIQTRRREVTARNDLLEAETDYQFSLDAFRIRLGLAEAQEIRLGDEQPPFEAVRLDSDSAVAVALNNRLDLVTARQRMEDSGRQIAIARDGLLPDVDLDLGYGLGRSAGSFGGATAPDEWRASAGLRVDLPLQRLPERNAYRAALIDNDQAVRDYELTLQNTERDVRDSLRNLDQLEEQIALAEQQIRESERAVALTQIRFESGDSDARDLLESRQTLVDAQNALIQFQVSHFVARLRLYRDLGLLFIDQDGNWRT